MNNIDSRVKRMLNNIESTYTDLKIESKTYGYLVTYVDSLGYHQMIDVYAITGRRKYYIVRWVSNGNMKLRLPA